LASIIRFKSKDLNYTPAAQRIQSILMKYLKPKSSRHSGDLRSFSEADSNSRNPHVRSIAALFNIKKPKVINDFNKI